MQHQMQDFKFFYGLCLSQRIFSISDNLSKSLQSERMSAVSGLSLANLTIETFKKMRTDDSAKLFYDATVRKASLHAAVGESSLPRTRKRPNYKSIADYMQVEGYQENADAYHPVTEEEHYRNLYNEAIDLAISSIKERFQQPAFIAF